MRKLSLLILALTFKASDGFESDAVTSDGSLLPVCINDGFNMAFYNLKHYLTEVTDKIMEPLTKPRLYWATARLDPSTCSTYLVEIRYHCINWGFNKKTELAKFDELCNDLIPKGLKKHIEREDLFIDGQFYKLHLNVVKTDAHADNSRMINIVNDCYIRSNNVKFFPIEIGFCMSAEPEVASDGDYFFMYTVAHEFGHDIVRAGEGFIYNYFHKGSSTIWQATRDDGPVADCNTGEELDVMFYYHDYKESCREDEMVKWKDDLPALGVSKFYNLMKLSKRDAVHLVENAFQEPTPPSCMVAMCKLPQKTT